MKVAIVYWSGTGNTENIMNLVKKGVEQAGAQADVYMPWDFEPSMMDQYTNFAFGSPAMGDEQLETEDFQPMWEKMWCFLAPTIGTAANTWTFGLRMLSA